MSDARRFRAAQFARLAVAALALGVAGPATADESEEWVRDAGPDAFYVSPTNKDGEPTHVVIRIVDHATGDPLPGASVALVRQAAYPLTGPASPERVARADEDGWIRLRADDLGPGSRWQYVYTKYLEAPGHAGLALPNGLDAGEFRLSRARTATVEVRDALDRPVPGATIGLIGSQHYRTLPDQRVVVTGADGRATVPNVAPREGQEESAGWEGWVVHGSIEADYHQLEFPSWRSDHVQILRHGPAHAVEGTILHADGTPAVGLPVGGTFRNRGPWTRTDSQGNFRLEGAPTAFGAYPCWIDVVADEAAPLAQAPSFVAPPAGYRRTLRLPAKGAPVVPPASHPVEIVLRDSATKAPIEGRVPVVAVREADGETFTNEKEPIAALPPGAWTILVGGGASPWALVRARLNVLDAKDAPTTTLVVDVRRNPEMRIEFAGDPAENPVELVTATDVRKITPEELSARSVPVPANGECAFRVGYEPANREKQRSFAPIPAGARLPSAKPFHIPSPKPVVVHATLAGPDGKSVPGWLATGPSWWFDEPGSWEPEGPAGLEPEVSDFAEGRIDLLAIAEDRTLAPRLVTVPLPPGSIEGGVVDAGRVALESRGDTSLTVVAAEGKPLEYAQLRVTRGTVVRTWGHEVIVTRGTVVRTWEHEEGVEVFDPRLSPLAAGDVVEVVGAKTAKRYATSLRRRLEGPGPWTIRDDRPDTSIVVDPCDEQGKPFDAVLVIDGKAFDTEATVDDDGTRHPFELAGLAPGPHRIAVSARDCVTRLYRVVLKAGEHRTIQARLRERPKPPVEPR